MYLNHNDDYSLENIFVQNAFKKIYIASNFSSVWQAYPSLFKQSNNHFKWKTQSAYDFHIT